MIQKFAFFYKSPPTPFSGIDKSYKTGYNSCNKGGSSEIIGAYNRHTRHSRRHKSPVYAKNP